MIIGVDLGGSKVAAGLVDKTRLVNHVQNPVTASGTETEVLSEVEATIDSLYSENIKAIGIGVPSVVDVRKGIVYDVQNIPSWQTVHLREILEERYKVPVYINNDANCFALGEKQFGAGQSYQNLIGLIIGTGLGAGVIIENHIYAGVNCGAGEFGMMPYLDGIFEDYCSGQFFTRIKSKPGEYYFERAQNGDQAAQQIYQEFGGHLGHAIKTILYAYDPELIVFGGSVSRAYEYFQERMWDVIQTFEYSKSLDRLKIVVSQTPNIAILGAAALCFEHR